MLGKTDSHDRILERDWGWGLDRCRARPLVGLGRGKPQPYVQDTKGEARG